MPTKFSSEEEVKCHIASYCGLTLDEVVFEEVPDLKVCGLEVLALGINDLPPEDEQRIKAHIDAQRGYKFQTPVGEGQIVIEPFYDGFCCWIIGQHNSAVRI